METPYWWIEAPIGTSSPGMPDLHCDVAIIGAGYTGLAAAIELARAGKSVQVFDALRPGEGASARNGGIASGNLRYSLSAAIEAFGTDAAVAMFQEGHEARADLATFVADENIDCDYQPNGRFTGAINQKQLEGQKREAEILRRYLDIDAYAVDQQDLHKEIATDVYCGGLVREDLALLHPGKLHAGMLGVAKSAGATVHGDTPVSRYQRNRNIFEVSAGGHIVKAGRVIVATNGYTGAADPWLRRRLVPVTSRIVVTTQLPPELMHTLLPKGRAMGENRNLFRYYRPTPDGKRILLGSRERALPASQADNAAHVFAGLLDIFPELEPFGFEYSWNGNVAFSRDELPGLFDHDGAIYACGYCGSGVVWARWLGTRAAHKVLGSDDRQSRFETSPPPAVPFYRGKPWFLPAIMAYYHWQDHRAARRRNQHKV